MGTDLLEDLSVLLLPPMFPNPVRILPFAMQNAGLDGVSRDIVSLLSITTTFDIVGLSVGLSWTHNKAICVHLNNSLIGYCSPNDGSATSVMVPLVQFSHTYVRVS